MTRKEYIEEVLRYEDERIFKIIMELANTTEVATQTDLVGEQHFDSRVDANR